MITSTRRSNRTLVAVAILAAALFVSLFASVQGADAAKLTACVNKKSGAMKMVTGKKAKKKCPKGSRKVSWDKKSSGLQVKDAKGRLVGSLVGTYPMGPPIFFVLRDGGQYTYYGSGQLVPLTPVEPIFKTSDCSGQAYIESYGAAGQRSFVRKLLGGTFRVVFRVSSGMSPAGFGPTNAWKSTGKFEAATALQMYARDTTTGVCTPEVSLTTADLLLLKRVKAPPDFTGPLVLR